MSTLNFSVSTQQNTVPQGCIFDIVAWASSCLTFLFGMQAIVCPSPKRRQDNLRILMSFRIWGGKTARHNQDKNFVPILHLGIRRIMFQTMKYLPTSTEEEEELANFVFHFEFQKIQ